MDERVARSALLRAAQYVRMSTEHQQYSTENQSAAIARYATEHGMEIVRSYVDAGKSGLKLAGRDALQELIRAVETRQADFDFILVYDISRWGRFQDADESAYYEYVCKRAGIAVHYCAESFNNDNSAPSNLLKALKRTMAGEFSRELSSKVFAGQCRLIELGFRQGGLSGYGLRRQLIDRDGSPKAILGRGECKSIQTDRVILVPGPAKEVAIVKEVYELFTDAAKTAQEIADLLNLRGVLHDSGREWTRWTVCQLLTNPKYIGANVYNRRSFKLRKKHVNNPREVWLWQGQAFTPIIPVDQFLRAQTIMQARHRRYTKEEMLDLLRRLLARKGALSGPLIDEAEDMPSNAAYRARFGNLTRAFKLIGYTPTRDYSYVEANRRIREVYRQQLSAIIAQLQKARVKVDQDPSTNLLTINGEYTASFILARCRTRCVRTFRWLLRLDSSLLPDIIIAGRMGPANRSVFDYYLLPCLDLLESQIRLGPDNPISLDVYRFEDLTAFIGAARRATLTEMS
jgi:DNA invertase Pin-like site-specific DNA recombinase